MSETVDLTELRKQREIARKDREDKLKKRKLNPVNKESQETNPKINEKKPLLSNSRDDESKNNSFGKFNRSRNQEVDPNDSEILNNDYSQHFVDTGERPQNFVRDANMEDRFEEYPILKDLVQKKDELVNARNTRPFYLNADLEKFDLASLNTTFDVIVMDPPLEESLNNLTAETTINRKEGEKRPFWTVEELEKLNIGSIVASPCFLFLWTGDGGEGLEIGRRLLKKWGFRRSEDIVWVKTNKDKPQQLNPFRDKSSTFVRTKEHCLMGIKGSVRRNIDSHVIHSNIDTDVIIAEEPKLGSTRKPEELYSIIEHFALGRRRLELFGEDHNIRPGWVTIGDKITSSNWDSDLYNSYFEPVSYHGNLLGTTPEIENLRPRSPSRDDSKILYYYPNKKISNKGPPDRDID